MKKITGNANVDRPLQRIREFRNRPNPKVVVTVDMQDFAGTMKLLRNPDFQKLLLEYPRAKRTFLTTIEDKDVVTSQKLERYGKFDNAEDYLDAFSKFVKANADKVAALSVLLQHPRD